MIRPKLIDLLGAAFTPSLRRALSALACVLAFFAQPALAAACQCNRPGPVADEAKAAELIFVAEPGKLGAGAPTMKVRRVYKGSVPSETIVYQSDCYSVIDTLTHDEPKARAKGGAVLVYGYLGGDRIYPTMCGRSAFVSDAAEDLKYLDATFPAPPASAGAAAAPPPPRADVAPTASSPVAPEPATSVPKATRPASGCGCVYVDGDGGTDAAPHALGLVLVAGVLAWTRRRAAITRPVGKAAGGCPRGRR